MTAIQTNNPEIPVKHLLRVDEAAIILRCSHRSVRRYIREGKLVRHRRGLIVRSSLMRHLGLFDDPGP